MNWYNFLKTSAAPNALKRDGLLEIFNAYHIKDQLKGYGFRFWPQRENNPWYMSIYNLTPEIERSLRDDLGVIFENDEIPATYPSTPTSVSPAPVPDNLRDKNMKIILAITKNTKIIPPGTPVAVMQVADNLDYWRCSTEDGVVELIKDSELRSKVESVKDVSGLGVVMMEGEESVLFDKYRILTEGVEKDDVEEKITGPKGRIPEGMISEYQRSIESNFINGDSHMVINALAGTGKTSVLKHISSFKPPGEKWLYLVFNKKNQVEAQGEFPPGVTVMTSHAFMGKVLGQTRDSDDLPKTQIKDNRSRHGTIVDRIVEKSKLFPRTKPSYKFPKGRANFTAKMIVNQVVGLAKANALDPRDSAISRKIKEMIVGFGISTILKDANTETERDYISEVIETSVEVLGLSLPGAASGPDKYLRDHNDTLWYPAIFRGAANWPSGYDVVLADEIQDFNNCQIVMLDELAKKGSKIVAVGDHNQSIYMFRGAKTDAFSNVESMLKNTDKGAVINELPVNYRCGTAIVDYVNQNPNTPVSSLQAGVSYEGEVNVNMDRDTTLNSFEKEWEANGGKFDKQTAFISRTNAPLIESALKFITKNIDFEIIGRDVSKELIDLVNKVTKKNVHIEDFSAKLSDYLSMRESMWGYDISRSNELKDLRTTVESLSSIIYSFSQYDDKSRTTTYPDPQTGDQIDSSSKFVNYIQRKFKGTDMERGRSQDMKDINELKGKDPKSFVTLTTAHRSKGLEFDRVFIIDIDNFPSKKAETEEEISQEANALYVALTRAKNELNILNPDEGV